MEELNDQDVNAAIILENRVNERIKASIRHEVRHIVTELVNELLRREKGAMLMEVTVSVNQMLKSFIDERRKPLWDSTPEEFGLSASDFAPHKLQPDKTTCDVKEIYNAICEQTETVQERISTAERTWRTT